MEQSYIRVMVGAMDRANRVIAVEYSANRKLSRNGLVGSAERGFPWAVKSQPALAASSNC